MHISNIVLSSFAWGRLRQPKRNHSYQQIDPLMINSERNQNKDKKKAKQPLMMDLSSTKGSPKKKL